MPFTPSHVLAVLPLTRGRAGRFFDGAALAIGAMVPDLPYFVPPYVGSRWTHAWHGPVTLDLLLGLVLLAVWRAAVPGLLALSPRWLRARAPGPRNPRVVPDAAAVIVGAVTHVVWDTFSHPHRWGTDHVAWLMATHGPLAGYKWIQYGSGVLGLAGLGLWFAAWVRRTPPRAATTIDPDRRRTAWALAALALALAVGWTWVRGAMASGRWLDEATAVAIASHSISLALLAVLVVAVRGTARTMGR